MQPFSNILAVSARVPLITQDVQMRNRFSPCGGKST